MTADVRVRVIRLRATLDAVVVGVLAAVLVFIATNWLVLKGGPVVGPHLVLLAQFCPGYRVTFAGSLVGAVWAFAWGFVVSWAVSALYNVLAARRADASR